LLAGEPSEPATQSESVFGEAKALNQSKHGSGQAVVQFPPLPPSPKEPRIVKRVFARFPKADPDEVLRFITERFPREIYEFRTLSIYDEEEAVQFLSELVLKSLRLLKTGESAPSLLALILELEALEDRVESQAAEVLQLKGAGRKKAIGELTETVGKAVNVRLQIKEVEINQVERELEGLKTLLRKMKQSRKDMVSRRVYLLTGERVAGRL
jgi:hypothetical protein